MKKEVYKDKITSVESEWKQFKSSLVKAAESTCGRTLAFRRYKEIPWWNNRIAEEIKKKNYVWREWYIKR